MHSHRLLPIALLVLLAAGCDTGDVTAPPTCTNGLSGFVTATIDGEAFEADCRTFSLSGGTLTVTGSTVSDDDVQREVTLVVTDYAAGFHAVGSGAAVTYEVTEGGATRRYVGESGEVVVEQDFPENPTGTFSFSARDDGDAVMVTEGRFDVYE